ncbi:hypothetical protein L596_012505 [Steinernema carpocapsae]|uniref:SCP domain-containing protein n=1 Tax=Steinernema carpocapsae TaxID=34508 RepID=A0A4V6A4T4_STECR|nr:hypothetical protein L596_012505 [Steinernema carpocapsae]
MFAPLVVLSFASFVLGQNCPTTGMTPAVRKAILDRHNQLRSQNALGNSFDGSTKKNAPQAKNMYKIVYDCELEQIAQKWADNCKFEHSPSNIRNAGENLYMSYPTVQNNSPALKASDSWWSELTDNGVGKISPDFNLTMALFNTGVGHYTQMAWAKTTKLGCGQAKCPKMNLVVCNYRQTGNYLNEKIYEIGSPCQKDSDCVLLVGSKCSKVEGLCIAP